VSTGAVNGYTGGGSCHGCSSLPVIANILTYYDFSTVNTLQFHDSFLKLDFGI
jgi:hypothetical protein